MRTSNAIFLLQFLFMDGTHVAKGCKTNYKNIRTKQPGLSVELVMRLERQTS